MKIDQSEYIKFNSTLPLGLRLLIYESKTNLS